MTDDEIRGLVRLAIQKHLGTPSVAQPEVASAFRRTEPVGPPQTPPLSISFGRYALPRAEDDTMCLIEAEVKCNHCGYCQCHGH